MTRKDWEFMARFFERELRLVKDSDADVRDMVYRYANECDNQFANFNRERFLEACGAKVKV